MKAQLEWTSYSSGNYVVEIERNHKDLWIASLGGGLIKVNTLTGDRKIFKYFSGIMLHLKKYLIFAVLFSRYEV